MESPAEPAPASASPARRRIWRRRLVVGAGIAAIAAAGLWLAREPLTRAAIDHALARQGLPATYTLGAVGPGGITLNRVVIGDPRHPDFTADRITVAIAYGLTGPGIGRVDVTGARLYGRYADGALHFGALDPLFGGASGAGPVLPGWALGLVDARARIDTPAGAIGLSADGSGPLADGFAGSLGVVMPEVRAGACRIARTTFFGQATTRKGRPALSGPLRLGAGDCGTARFGAGRVDLAIAADAAMTAFTINARAGLGAMHYGPDAALAGLSGEAGLRWDTARSVLAGRVTLNGQGVDTRTARLDSARFDGMVEAHPAEGRFDLRGDLDAAGLGRGPQVAARLAAAHTSLAGTPFVPLLGRMDAALRREEPGSRLAGAIGIHADAAGWRVAMPRVVWRGGHSGLPLARLDQMLLAGGDGHIPRIAGDFAMVGADLPRLSGHLTTGRPGSATFAVTMPTYAAADAQLAVPAMAITQTADGSLGFSGTVELGGPFAGGRVEGLQLPVEGGLAGDGHMALWRRCVTASFTRLVAGSLDLAPARIGLCPVSGAIVRQGPAGLTLGAAASGLALDGTAGAAPLMLKTGAVELNWPGTSSADAVDVVLGKADGASRYRLAHATLDPPGTTGGVPGGSFSGGSIDLAGLPATAGSAAGTWRFDQGKLKVAGATLMIADRAQPARFAPVAARDGTVTLDSAGLSGTARLVNPVAGADLARVTLRHDLASGRGHADIAIDALTFRMPDAKAPHAPALQPVDLTELVRGNIANAAGTVHGSAKFDWNTAAADGGVSGSGTFGSDDFDFAAAFGPVEGVSGTVTFTDLVHLVTAPHQVLKVASINPGIEVVDGTIDLELPGNQIVRLNRAHWPFEGGTLELEPVDLNMAVAEPRRFSLVINGLEAGRFLQHVNMSNISARGVFDGRLPLVFDANGGRITGGKLVSRAPGGNVSYVGALSYRDLTPMANFAFKMLRSVDFRAMTIGMEGDLGGEVVTSVSFGGISQGKGAERNLVTRQLANLPIRFDINVRSQFRHLMGTLGSLYDPSLLPDPRALGLVDEHGRPLHHHGVPAPADPAAMPAAPAGPAIQPQASGTMP